MRHTFLALTVAALASFATASHANDGPLAGSTMTLPEAKQSLGQLLVALGIPELVRLPHRRVTPADLKGKGTIGEPCHADEANNQGGSNHIYAGRYKEVFGKLKCCSPIGDCIDCRKDDNSYPPKSTCFDGVGSP